MREGREGETVMLAIAPRAGPCAASLFRPHLHIQPSSLFFPRATAVTTQQVNAAMITACVQAKNTIQVRDAIEMPGPTLALSRLADLDWPLHAKLESTRRGLDGIVQS